VLEELKCIVKGALRLYETAHKVDVWSRSLAPLNGSALCLVSLLLRSEAYCHLITVCLTFGQLRLSACCVAVAPLSLTKGGTRGVNSNLSDLLCDDQAVRVYFVCENAASFVRVGSRLRGEKRPGETSYALERTQCSSRFIRERPIPAK